VRRLGGEPQDIITGSHPSKTQVGVGFPSHFQCEPMGSFFFVHGSRGLTFLPTYPDSHALKW
jgi:hypothetical protein